MASKATTAKSPTVVVAAGGNTIKLGKAAYRLHGMDAPDTLQSCGQWSASLMVAGKLHALIVGR